MTTAAIAAAIRAGTARLCWCWRVTRQDGQAFGFTDHDRDLVVEGVTFRAASAISPTELSEKLGGATDFAETVGALDDEAITEADLAAGKWDGAHVEVWRVDWSDPANRMLAARGWLGEVTRGGPAFRAEFRSLSSALQQPTGRVNTPFCDADLGDARCGVDLSLAAWRTAGTVAAGASALRFTVAAAAARPAGFFAHGEARFAGGALDGLAREIRGSQGGAVELWEPLPAAPAEGQAVTLIAGCDKTFATCKAKFANAVNFRGNPYQTGDDAQQIPTDEAGHDGGSRFA